MKRIVSIATLVLAITLCLNLAACATFQPFNHSYVRKFRRELMNSYSCIDEFGMKIGYGDSLVVECRLQEDTEYELANEIYQCVTAFICTDEIVDDYFDAIDEIWGQIKLSFGVGTDPQQKHFNYTHSIYKGIENEEYNADFYSDFGGWPEEYSELPEF